ncbi:uncharacterized protein LOC135463047 [Liolophura sinensis]|uniref:uncharacterized protein LOC135463047 n=1 Tax=Liolophura sinensis TaxID=3198878 RepID=UPI00315845C3
MAPETTKPTKVTESITSVDKDLTTDDSFVYSRTTPGEKQAIDFPANFTFIQTVKYFDSLACPRMTSQCSPGVLRSFSRDCSPFWCPGCSCVACDLHKDCCADAALDAGAQSDAYKHHRSCLTPTAKMADLYEEQWYYFVDRCPSLYVNTSLKYLCEKRQFYVDDMDTYFPVYSRLTGENYINIYCARCHGDAYSLIPWEPEVFCYDAKPLKDIGTAEDIVAAVFPRDQCVVTAAPPDGIYFQSCNGSLGIVQRCNQSGLWQVEDEDVATACDSYMNRVYINDVWYRNVFCAFCNGVPRSEVVAASSSRICAQEPLPAVDTKKGSVPVMLSYNVKLRTNAGSETMAECDEDKVYEPVKGECRQLFCSPSRYVHSHECKAVFKTARGVPYTVIHLLTPQDAPYRLQTSTNYLASLYLISALEERRFLSDKLMSDIAKIHVCYESHYRDDNGVFVHFLVVQSDVIWKTSSTPAQVEEELLQTINVTFWFDNVIWTPEILTDGRILSTENMTCYTLSWSFYTSASTSTFKYEYDTDSYIALHELTGCKQIELEPNEYSINMKTGQLYVKYLNISLDRSGYLMVDGKVRICVDYSGKITRNLNSSSRRRISRWLMVFSLVMLIRSDHHSLV